MTVIFSYKIGNSVTIYFISVFCKILNFTFSKLFHVFAKKKHRDSCSVLNSLFNRWDIKQGMQR